jgi:hypothetical protein
MGQTAWFWSGLKNACAANKLPIPSLPFSKHILKNLKKNAKKRRIELNFVFPIFVVLLWVFLMGVVERVCCVFWKFCQECQTYNTSEYAV